MRTLPDDDDIDTDDQLALELQVMLQTRSIFHDESCW